MESAASVQLHAVTTTAAPYHQYEEDNDGSQLQCELEQLVVSQQDHELNDEGIVTSSRLHQWTLLFVFFPKIKASYHNIRSAIESACECVDRLLWVGCSIAGTRGRG